MAKEKVNNKCHECDTVIESESHLLEHFHQEHGLTVDLSQFIETQNQQSNELPVIYETINTPLGCIECDFQGTNGAQLIKHYEEVHQKSFDEKNVNNDDEWAADTSCYSFENEKPPAISENNTNSEIIKTESMPENLKSEVKNEVVEENVTYMSLENYGQNFGLKCPYCQGVFIVLDHLRDHIEVFHKNIKLEFQQNNFETSEAAQQQPETEPVCEYQAGEFNFSDPTTTTVFPNITNLDAINHVPSEQSTSQIGTTQ